MAQIASPNTTCQGKTPTFLYLKQGIFYYRYRFPEPLRQRMYHSEIRISLRTGYRAQALRIARILHVYLLKITEATPLPSVEELRALLQQRLDEILGAPDKCPVTRDEIRRRLNGYMRYLLDCDAQPDGRISMSITHPDGSMENLGLDGAFMEAAAVRQNDLNHADIATWLPLSIMELLAENVFDPQEIWHDNPSA